MTHSEHARKKVQNAKKDKNAIKVIAESSMEKRKVLCGVDQSIFLPDSES